MTETIGYDGRSPVPLVEDVLDEQQIERYLALLREHIGADLAAREVGQTATRMSRFAKRDPNGFGARVAEAIEEGKIYYRERLQAQSRLRALDTERPSDRMLEVELATHVPDYAHLRRDRFHVEAKVEHGIIGIPPGALDALDPEKLELLAQILAELGSGIVDGEATEILEIDEGDG